MWKKTGRINDYNITGSLVEQKWKSILKTSIQCNGGFLYCAIVQKYYQEVLLSAYCVLCTLNNLLHTSCDLCVFHVIQYDLCSLKHLLEFLYYELHNELSLKGICHTILSFSEVRSLHLYYAAERCTNFRHAASYASRPVILKLAGRSIFCFLLCLQCFKCDAVCLERSLSLDFRSSFLCQYLW